MNSVYYEKITFPLPVNGMEDCYARIIDRNDRQNDTTLHWHNSLEIVLVLEGSVRYVVDGVYHITQAGHFHLINSRFIHAATKNNIGRIHTLILEISDAYLEKVCPGVTPCAFRVEEGTPVYQEILGILYDIVPLVSDSDPFSQFALSGRFNQILYLLFRNCQVPVREDKGSSRKVLHYVNQHYQEPVTLEDAAAVAGFQKNYFCRWFKKETGYAFKQYLNYVRLNAALSLLADEQGTALQCALHSGFSSEKALIEWCRKIHGCTPTTYIKQLRGET